MNGKQKRAYLPPVSIPSATFNFNAGSALKLNVGNERAKPTAPDDIGKVKIEVIAADTTRTRPVFRRIGIDGVRLHCRIENLFLFCAWSFHRIMG